MASEINIELEVPVINFDIIQGQDLALPVEYTTVGVTDTLDGASLAMEVRTPDYQSVIDTLTTVNNRILITGANKFSLVFPKSASSSYVMKGSELKLIYGLELTGSDSKTKRIFEGVITVKREQTINV